MDCNEIADQIMGRVVSAVVTTSKLGHDRPSELTLFFEGGRALHIVAAEHHHEPDMKLTVTEKK